MERQLHRGQSERVILLKKNFIKLKEDGYSVEEIAKRYNVSSGHVYGKILQQIADENGVSRDSLLQEIHKTPNYWRDRSAKLQVDLNKLSQQYDAFISELNVTIEGLGKIVDSMEKEEEGQYE